MKLHAVGIQEMLSAALVQDRQLHLQTVTEEKGVCECSIEGVQASEERMLVAAVHILR